MTKSKIRIPIIIGACIKWTHNLLLYILEFGVNRVTDAEC